MLFSVLTVSATQPQQETLSLYSKQELIDFVISRGTPAFPFD